MKARMAGIVLTGTVLCALTGCSYYRITDPHTNKVYYAKRIDERRSGSVVITDKKTNKKVTLPESEIEKISRDEFIVGVYENNK